MPYDAIRDQHVSPSPSVTPSADPTQMQRTSSNNSQAYSHSQPGTRPSTAGRHDGGGGSGGGGGGYSSRPGSSSGLGVRGLLNADNEGPIGGDRRRSSGSQSQTHGGGGFGMAVPPHRVEHGHPSFGSVMSQGRSSPPVGYGYGDPRHGGGSIHGSGGGRVSPVFAVPIAPSPASVGSQSIHGSGGGYPFPVVNHSGLYHTQISPTLRNQRSLPPTGPINTSLPSGSYHPMPTPTAPSPSPSASASIHNLVSSAHGSSYRSPSIEFRQPPTPGQGMGLGVTGEGGRRLSNNGMGMGMAVPMGRSLSGGSQGGEREGMQHGSEVRTADGRRVVSSGQDPRATTRITGYAGEPRPDQIEIPSRRSSVMGWSNDMSVMETPSMMTPSRASLAGVMSPSESGYTPANSQRRSVTPRLETTRMESVSNSNMVDPDDYVRGQEVKPTRKLSVVDLASPGMETEQPLPSSSSSRTRAVLSPSYIDGPALNPLATPLPKPEPERQESPEPDAGLPDGSSMLDLLATMSAKAGAGQVEIGGEAGKRRASSRIIPSPESTAVREALQEQRRDMGSSSQSGPLSPTHTEIRNSDAREETMDVEEPKSKKRKLSLGVETPSDPRSFSPVKPSRTSPFDLASQIFPENEMRGPTPPPAEPEPPRNEYKPHNRVSAPTNIMRPASTQEWEWYLDVTNSLNPLRKGSQVKRVGEGKGRPAGPSFDSVALERSDSRKRRRPDEGTNGHNGAEDYGEDRGPKRARRGVAGTYEEDNEAAAHYNSRGNIDREVRKESLTIGVKRCNNWIKSILIKRFTRRRPGVIDYHPGGKGTRPNGRVLDLGCGKGGDIEKWDRAKIAEYVGVDVAAGSISDFNDRIRDKARTNRRLSYQAHLYVLDCYTHPIDLSVPKHLLEPKFDTVTMQFCMHYAFDAEAKVRQMLENVSKYLRVGGMFIGTTPSSKKILELLDAIPSDAEDLLIGNGYYQLVFEERHHEGLYGHAYRYTLVDAVDDVTEWIVYWKEFEELAAEYGLKRVYVKDFDEIYTEEILNQESAALAEKMRVTQNGEITMDADQWSAVSIYLGFAFIKVDS